MDSWNNRTAVNGGRTREGGMIIPNKFHLVNILFQIVFVMSQNVS